ncbi:hypothetical protein I598_1896 [Isoptericola dokdonensis DS-3]|uniref:Uncharacterized protein n=1 Tax=Isoptericola dokdonensis DS-3 TaxID=1300344 RepID=A0A161II19_9MICO|nr:hypothetical protein I598_1896 [Isoptericola dokdonensis DS-3]
MTDECRHGDPRPERCALCRHDRRLAERALDHTEPDAKQAASGDRR